MRLVVYLHSFYSVYTISIAFLAAEQASLSLGQIGTTTEDEEFALTEFKELVSGRAYRHFMQSDGYLIRWLQQTNFNVEEAVANFDKFLDWREFKNVDSVLLEDFSAMDRESSVSFTTYHDKDGRPVVLAPVGRFDFRKVILSGAEPLYQRYAVRLYELCEHSILQIRNKLTQINIKPSHNVSQVVFLADLAGFNLKTGACYQCLKAVPELATTLNSYYPGLAHKIYFINTPAAFKSTFDLIVSFLSENTRGGISVHGFDRSEWERELLAQIPRDELPAEYGGTRPTFLGKLAKEAQLRHIQGIVASAKEAARRERSDGRVDSEPTPVTPVVEEGNHHNNNHHHHHHHVPKQYELRASGTRLTPRGFGSPLPPQLICLCLLSLLNLFY